MFKRFPLFFLCAALFSGCATHPKHTPAAVETAETLGLPASSQPPIAPQWWRALNDAKLDGLIDTALARSPDLAAAQARLRQAQALDNFAPNPAANTPAPPVSQLTADLLGKRPDLAAQREALTARRHLVASAKTEFYPNITIKALAGLSNVEIGNLPHSSSWMAGLLPSVSLPIFTSGALRANLSRKEAEFDEQAARYNKNVYTALREAADALTQYETAAAAVRDQTEMTALARKNAAAAQSRFHAGLDNKLDFLAAQDETLQNEAQLAQAQAKLFTAWLALNTAFGGGFAADK